MKIYIDSAKLDDIKKSIEIYPISGVTTNPSNIIKVEPKDLIRHIHQIKKLNNNGELHIQVVSEDYEGMLLDAQKIVKEFGKETYIKVPVTENGLKAIKELKRQEYHITATNIFTKMQAYLVLAFNVDYIAVYVNRISSLGNDPFEVIKFIRNQIDEGNYHTQIIGASYRKIEQLEKSISAGAHSITLDYPLLEQILNEPYILESSHTFTQKFIDYFKIKSIHNYEGR